MILEMVLAGLATFAIILCVDWFTNRGSFSQSPEDDSLAINQLTDESLMTATDKEMLEKTRECIHHHFGQNVTDTIISMSGEQRVKAMEELIRDLCEKYHISINRIDYFQDSPHNCGAFTTETNMLHFNIQYLMSNRKKDILEYLDTVIHELQHAVQWSVVIEENEFWYVTDEIRKQWLINFVNYIPAHRDFKGYKRQPIELKAVTFAHLSLKGVA